MGSSTETIRNLQVVGIMEKYGGLYKSLFFGEAQKISSGMPVVREQRQSDIIMIKSMYNEGYLDALGYDPVSKIKVKNINKVILLNYTKSNINASAYKIITASIRPVTVLDIIKKSIQFRDTYDPITLSYLDGSTRLYCHDSVDTGNYIEAVFYERVPLATITSYLDDKYVDGVNKLSYTILRISDLASLIEGSLKFTVKIKYVYKKTTVTNGQPFVETITDYTEEYFEAPLRYETLDDINYSDLKSIANSFTKPVSYKGSAEIGFDDFPTSMTITGQQTATIKNGTVELTFSFKNPYKSGSGGYLNHQAMIWEAIVGQYKQKQLDLLEVALDSSIRKIVWEYETGYVNYFIAIESVHIIPKLINEVITEVYPIIPIKENLRMVKNTTETKLVLSKIGLERGDLIDSLSNPDIRSSFLVFGVLPNNKSQENITYLYEYFFTISNSTSSDVYGRNITETNVTIEYKYKSAAGIKQTYSLGFVQVPTEGDTAPKEINSYWYQSHKVKYVSRYETVYDETGMNSRQEPVYSSYYVHSYCKQVTATHYNKIILYNIMAGATTSGYPFSTSLLEDHRTMEGDAVTTSYHPKGKDWDIRIPIIRDITNIMRFDYLCNIIERSMSLLVFTEVEVKVEWYQQPWVTMVTFAVAAYTGQYYVVAATTAATMATVVVVAGVAMTATTALIIGVTMLTLTMLSLMGIDLGIFGVIASVALVVMGGYALLASTNTLTIGMKQIVMLATQTAKLASQVNSYYFNKNIKELAKEQTNTLEFQSAEIEKLKEETDKLLENTVPGGINMFGSEIPNIDNYYALAEDDFDQYEIMYNFAVDYDSMFKTV